MAAAQKPLNPGDPVPRSSHPDACLEAARARLAADTSSEEDLAAACEEEREDYMYSHRVAHTYDDGELDELFEVIESSRFLAAQAEYFEGFQASSRDLESYVLPAAVRRAEWPRFLHLALLAASFRGLADALADEEILAALVRHGYRRLARDVAAQLADPAVRARARAAVLAAEPRAPGAGELVRQLTDDLDAVPAATDEASAEARLVTLVSVARHLGPRLHHRWADWIEPLRPHGDRAAKAWEAVAESWIRDDGWTEPGLRQALIALGDPERVAQWLPRRVADAPGRSGAILPLLEDSPLGGERLELHLRIALLARPAREGAAGVEAAWERLAERSLPWSVRFVELGRELWPRLGGPRLTALTRSIDDAEARAALLVVTAEEDADVLDPAAVLEAVEALAKSSARLHWSLRYLAALPAGRPQIERQLAAVIRYLHGIRYAVEAEDLARFLDLVGRYLPAELASQTENVVWSPASDAKTLLALASAATTRELLEQLLANAESYAAAVSSNEAEGFELRRALLIRIASRFARRWDDGESVERAARSLLPGEEEDELRSTVVRELLEQPDDEESLPLRRKLAARICEGLRSPRLALLARLRISLDPSEAASFLDPGPLYRAVASTDALQDEAHALGALLQVPEDPQDLANTHLSQIRDGERRVHSLVDLARHALRFQREKYRPDLRDLTAALQPLTEAVGTVASDEGLVSLTPELVEVGAELGVHRASAELQEACLRLFGRKQLDWSVRHEAFETLMGRLRSLLFQEERRDRSFLPRCRAAAGLLDWLMQLPSRPGDAREELRRTWHEVLPLVVAAAERLPDEVDLYLRHPLGARLCCEIFGLQPDLERCARAEALLIPRGLRRRAATPWKLSGPELVARWSWLTEEQKSVVLFCCLSPRERSLRAQELHPPNVLIPLLADRAPGLVRELLVRLPDAERERTCLRLLRHGWADAELTRRLPEMLEGPAAWRATLWDGLGKASTVGPQDWLKALASLLAAGLLDLLDPRCAPLRRHLWTIDGGMSCPALAEATVEALRTGGRPAAEKALRFWLHAYLGSTPAEEGRRREEKVLAAIRRAESIPTASSEVKPRPGAVERVHRGGG